MTVPQNEEVLSLSEGQGLWSSGSPSSAMNNVSRADQSPFYLSSCKFDCVSLQLECQDNPDSEHHFSQSGPKQRFLFTFEQRAFAQFLHQNALRKFWRRIWADSPPPGN